MKTLYVLTEERSCKIVFDTLLPKILPDNISFRVFPHQGKQDLIHTLEKVIPSISKQPDAKILIVIDQDNVDCIVLKNWLNDKVKNICNCQYAIRIVCTELESWYLGDMQAIKLAYPRFRPEHYEKKERYRDVDKIVKPNIQLLKIVPELKNKKTLPKLDTANLISKHININANTSVSFNHTISVIKKLMYNV